MPIGAEGKDGSRLLPSKRDGKSEIALLVVKPEEKECGHHEPCENIVCDVSVQQYVDHSGVLPMLAVGIQDDEINAPVSKHCKNPLCDALSIEHNRCRRALIKLYRFDEKSACDICGIVFKTRRSRISHKFCTRKDVYRHNQTNGAQVLREKMRERELQMIRASKTKKKDEYIDPAMEYKKTMEILRNNKELIVIPKSIPAPQPVITISTVSLNNQTNQLSQSVNSREVFGKIMPSIPFVFPQPEVGIRKRSGSNTIESSPMKQPKITNVYCSNMAVASVPQTQSSGQKFIKVSSVSQPNFAQPVSPNDWCVSQANIATSEQDGSLKPYLTPMKIVPITSLKSAPSLRHQTHGIPTFCLVPDNFAKAVPATKLQTIQLPPAISNPPELIEPENELTDEEKRNSQGVKTLPKGQKRSQDRRKSEEKNSKVFKCPYCLKGFSTDWYFKMHVAGHTGEMLFTCKTCEKPFSNRYDMKKHMLNEHNDGECRCEICGQISICKSALEIHIRSHTGERPFRCTECDMSYRSSTDLKTHRRKRHDSTDCPYCHLHVIKLDFKAHLISCHQLTEDEAQNEILQTQNQNINGNEFSEIEISDCELMPNEILMRIKQEMIKETACEPPSIKSEHGSSNSNKRKRRNGNKSGIRKRKDGRARAINGNKNSRLTKKNPTALKRAANNSKAKDINSAVRRSSRKSNSNFHCTVCKVGFDSTKLLEDHVATKPKEAVECRDCKSLFHSQTDLKKHNTTTGKCSCKQSCEYETSLRYPL